MNRWLAIGFVLGTVGIPACSRDESPSGTSVVCSDALYRMFEQNVPTGDGQGHGPDVGSDEWKSVIEFELGIRGNPDVPDPDSDAWCRQIDEIVRSGRSTSAESGDSSRPTSVSGPSFSCGDVAPDSIAATICRDEALSALDRELAEVYSAASAKATNEHPPLLRAEQRGWIKGRDDCWKSDDPRECVRAEYVHRIAELQARYRLVGSDGPVRFVCDDEPANEVVATYFRTDPPTLIAERGDSVSVMFGQPSASGSRYQGRNESLWEHQGEASIRWGYGAPQMSCKLAAGSRGEP